MFLNASNLSTTLYDFILNLAINDKINGTDYFLKCQYMGRMEVYFKNIVSGRKFDNELKRAKMVLSPDNIVQTYKGKSKYTSINHDYFIEENNILYNTYLAKAFKQNEFLLYFYILQNRVGRYRLADCIRLVL